MYCRKCGKEIMEDREFCQDCAAVIVEKSDELQVKTNADQITEKSVKTGQKKKCCPRCKSRNFQIVTEVNSNVNTTGGGYSAGKGCCGYIAFGPLGLLCGACGSSSKTTVTNTTSNYWVCKDCGNKFRSIEDIDALLAKAKYNSTTIPAVFTVLGVICSLFLLIIFDSTGADFIYTAPFSLSPLSIVIIGICMKYSAKQDIIKYEREKWDIEENGYIDE